MRCQLTDDAGEFLRRAEGYLTVDPVVNSVPLTLAVQRRDGAVVDPAPATYAVVTDGSGEAVGVALRTPPRGAYVSRMPAAAVPAVVEAFRAACPDLPGVAGTAEEATGFAELWCAGGRGYEVEMRQRIHRLHALVPPEGVAGEPRVAATADRELLVGWSAAFAEESDPARGDHDTVRADVDLRLAERRAHLWLSAGEPVSYVGHTPTVAGVARVGPVYTPVHRRGRGYASALVAAVSGRLLDAGAEAVCLFTDLANPTSNRIYAQVGYRPVCDAAVYRFTG